MKSRLGLAMRGGVWLWAGQVEWGGACLTRVGGARRGLSDLVYKARMMDYYSQNDTAVNNEFPRSKFVVMLDRKALVKTDGIDTRMIELPYDDVRSRLAEWGFEVTIHNSVFLDLRPAPDRVTMEGVVEYEGLFGTTLRTVALPSDSPVSIDRIRDDVARSFDGKFMDLRKAMLVMGDEGDRNRLAKLHTLSSWSSTYRRCPKCGSALRMRASRTAAECAPCQRFFYPTLSPVSITLIRDASDTHALLVRHRGSVNGVYTCVAGFAVAGESLTDCARREIAEEVGIAARSIQSLDMSQTWPMPDSSLMIAHEAVADMDERVQICPDELESAEWFSREEVREALERTLADPMLTKLSRNAEDRNDFQFIPPQGAIAHRIIRTWVERVN